MSINPLYPIFIRLDYVFQMLLIVPQKAVMIFPCRKTEQIVTTIISEWFLDLLFEIVLHLLLMQWNFLKSIKQNQRNKQILSLSFLPM